MQGTGAQWGSTELIHSCHRLLKNKWQRERGLVALTFHTVTVPATIPVPLVICKTGAFSFLGKRAVLEGQQGFPFQL